MKWKFVVFVEVLVLLLLSLSSGQVPLPRVSRSPDAYLDLEQASSATAAISASPMPPPLPGSTNLSALSGVKTAFYGEAFNDSIRTLVGYADYVVVSHAMYNDGEDCKDNIRYLATHGVRIILDLCWWAVWPFSGYIDQERYRALHIENLAWGMNGTETAKYRMRNTLNKIGAEYIWGVTVDEEVGDPAGEQFPWPLIAWYQNLFCDWLHEEFPSLVVFAWPAPPYPEFVANSGYHIRADGVVYDNYDQSIGLMGDIAYLLKDAYPDGPLVFLVSAAEYIGGWFTCHPPTYVKRVVAEVAKYADVVGFWTLTQWDQEVLWGWMDPEDPGYQLALRICNQIHAADWNSVYANTEWFECGFGNDTVTESLENWNSSYWYQVAPDPALTMDLATDNRVGNYAVNLTCTESGNHSYYWQFRQGHLHGYPDWPGTEPYGAYNLSQASRISFWVKGSGWQNHPDAQVRIFLEKSNYPAFCGKLGNMTLPEITGLLGDGAWHQVTLALPLDPSAYYEWDGYASQIRLEVDYSGSALGNTTTILFDGWLVDSFDTGKAYGLNTSQDYVAAENGTLRVGGSAYFEAHFPETDDWYYQYDGTGTITMCINGSWTAPPDEGMPCRWNVTAIRLANGSFDWIKINALPPIVEIQSPAAGALLRGTNIVEVNATDDSGIQRVEFALDGQLKHTSFAQPFNWTWDTVSSPDGVHRLNATAYANSGAANFYWIDVVVDNTPPTVSIVVPANDTLVSDAVVVNATAMDASGVAQVAFYVDGSLVGIDATAPYSCLWNTVAGPDGSRNVTCEAWDVVGNEKSVSYRLIVDNTRPSVAVHSLVVGDAQVLVAANATDASGILRVEFYLDGELNFTDYQYPYQWTWVTEGYLDGSYLVRVVAYDLLGYSGYVDAGVVVDRTLPTLSVTRNPLGSPVRGLVEVTAVASDANGIAHVEFLVDGHLEFTDFVSPYVWTWDTGLLGDGGHTLLVVAVDNYGNARQVQSEVTVDNSGPVIAVNNPVNGSVLEGPVAVSIVATVLDPSGIQAVLLGYSTGGVWTNLSMSPSGANYQGTIGTLLPGLTVRVKIYANDTLGNTAVTGVYVYYIVDQTGPTIGNPSIVPSVPSPFDSVVVSVLVSDGSGVSRVLLAHRIDAGAWTNLTMTGGPLFWAAVPAAAAGSVVDYCIFANDTLDQWSSSPTYQYTVVALDVLPPIVRDWQWSPSAPNETDAVTVSANVTDPSAVALVMLSYHDGSLWHNVSMTLQAGLYVGVVPALPYDTVVTLQVYACDEQGNWGVTPLGQYRVNTSDRTGPVTSTIAWTPLSPYENEPMLVTATITDASPIALALLSYNDGTSWRNLTMHAETSSYSVSVPAIGAAVTVNLRIFAVDDKGNWGVSDFVDIVVQALPPGPGPAPNPLEIAAGAVLGAAIVGVSILVVSKVRPRGGKRRK